ncbi:MAG TPA: AmmeMemoRadiSam system protein A [Vicinamibacterales bacterium]|nr:AmmeMemoRadiSam system protein A [Vicinamibacterales bacterium]
MSSRLTLSDQEALVLIARQAIAARVAGQSPPRSATLTMPLASGVFVTLKIGRHLRGCLGTLESRHDLAIDVARCAGDAASRDPRFPPVSVKELDELSVEISVLGPFEPCAPPVPASITVGLHGLLVEHGRRRGLLLPQVAVEWNWTSETFLEQTCLKAGLAAGAWRRDAAVYRFTAQVFGDAAR